MNKLLSAVCAVLLIALTAFPAAAADRTDTVNDIQRVVDGIVDWNLKESGCADVREWIGGPVADNAGMGSEWFVLTLCRSGEYDFSAYEAALKKYLAENTIRSATARLKFALVLRALGSDDPYIRESLENSVGQQGIMSWVYGLHLLNNGVECGVCTAEDAAAKLVALQLADGGWALTGANGDIDVTAMTLQALAPYAGETEAGGAVERSLAFLASRQQDDGGYASFGTKNPESAAQVLVALSSLGIDCTEDERFVKNGYTLLDGILRYRLPDGSFCHKIGDSTNNTATVQAYYSLLSWLRLREGKSGLYIFAPDTLPSAQEEPVQDGQQTPPAEDDPAGMPASDEKPDPADASVAEERTEPEDSSAEVTGGAEEEAPMADEPQETPDEVKTPAEPPETEPSAAIEEEPKESEPEPIPDEPEPDRSDAGEEPTTDQNPIPAAETESEAAGADGASEKKGLFTGYKPVACLIAVGVGAVVCLIFFVLGKRHPKNFIAIAGMTVLVMAVIIFTDVKSAEEYYSGEAVEKGSSFGTVTIEIRCDTIVDKSDADYIPRDGVILAETEYPIEAGDTVYDILTEAARQHHIQVETAGRWNMVYVAGINYLYELDFGDLSGWIYHVNGFSPSLGCGEYVLSDGDRIEWLYSCDIGNDLLD